MSRVKVLDKTFETSMPEAQIKARVKELAQQISKDMEGKNPLFLAVLSLKEIVEKNETQTADLMRRFAYHKEAYLNTGKAQGFDYTYEAGGKKGKRSVRETDRRDHGFRASLKG